MPNAVTVAVGLVVIAIIAFAAYYAYKSLKRGGCSGCGCDVCQKKDEHGCGKRPEDDK